MPRTLRIVGLSLAGLLALLVLLIVLIINFDWNRARPWINERVSNATGRQFAIQGDLMVRWSKPESEQTSWARWIPWPHVSAADIVLGNPDWAQAQSPTNGKMLSIKQLDVTLNPWPLLQHKIVLPLLQADTPQLALLRNQDSVNNWTFKSDDSPSTWQFRPEKIVIRQGSVQLDDAIQKIHAKAEINTLDPAKEKLYGIGWNVKGTFNKADIRGEGKAGGVLSLQDESKPYPLQADVRVGKTRIAVKGSLSKPQELAALDLQLSLSGDSMAHLYPLTGVLLPETPPFSTDGHLIGKLDPNNSVWTYEKFNGKVGSSDIGGTLEYQARQPRPLLKGEVVSNLLQFDDLAPLIGADSNAKKAERGAEERQPSNKVLPVKEFNTDSWGALDADVKLTARKVVKEKNLPVTDIRAELKMDNKLLSLTPLNFGIAGGNLTSNIILNGREPKMKSELKLSARRIKIQQLFPNLDAAQTSFGEINGDAALTSTGNSVAAMLGSSNGELKTLINHGAISKLLLEEMGLNIGNVVVSKLFGDKQVKLNCMASDFTVTNGLMQARTFTLDTEDAIVNISGDINLAQEQLNLTINPRSKGLRIISLRSPLFVTGPFKDPNIGVDKGVLALKAGGAVLLGVLAPVAAILPLINISGEQRNDCANLLEEVQKKPMAPAPGKTYQAKPAAASR